MRLTGIILIILQCIAIISRIIQNESFLNMSLPSLIGFFSFGILGVILIIKSKKNK